MIKQKCTTCEVTRYAVDKKSFPLNLVKMSVIFVKVHTEERTHFFTRKMAPYTRYGNGVH